MYDNSTAVGEVARAASPDLPRPAAQILRIVQHAIGSRGATSVEAPAPAHATLAELGVDSMTALAVRESIRTEFGVDLALVDLLGHHTVDEVAERLGAATVSNDIDPSPEIEPGRPPSLTPVQLAYWTGRRAEMEDGGVASWWYVEYRRVLNGATAHKDPLLEIELLQRAFATVVLRHPMLRLTVDRDGQPHIEDSMPVQFSVIDVRSMSDDQRADVERQTRKEWSHQLRDTEHGPLFDICVVVEEDTVLRICTGFDVLAIDFGSWQLIHRDWATAYAHPDQVNPAPELKFFDIVGHHHREQVQRARDYWAARLTDLPDPPQLSYRTRDAEERRSTRRFARTERRLDAYRWARLQQHATAQGISTTALMAAALALVLDRWGATDAFGLNLTLVDRPAQPVDAHEIVGDFTTTAILAVAAERPSTGTAFADMARSINRELFNALDHREYSGVEVARDRAAIASAALRPSYPVVLTCALAATTGDSGDDPIGAWLGEEIFGVSQTPQVHLDHLVWQERGELRLVTDHSLDHLDCTTINAMMDQHLRLLQRLADESGCWTAVDLGWDPSFDEIPDLTENAPPTVTAADPRLDGPVRAATALHPALPSVITPHGSLTHVELLHAATDAAMVLRRHGVHAGDLVAVVLDKSVTQIVTVRAILDAGAGYVPIDPAWPAQRIARICGRANITHAVVAATDSAGVPDHILAIEVSELTPNPAPASAIESPTAPSGAVVPELEPISGRNAAHPDSESDDRAAETAYVIFTSGSTGEPKGVVIEHRAARVTIDDVVTRLRLDHHDRVLGVAALSFDLSVFDIFGVPGVGGALVLGDPARARDPQHWLELIAAHQVTVWNSAPAVLEMLTEYCALVPGAATQLRSLRIVMVSGDWIPVTLPDRVRALIPTVEFHSFGGATEAAIWSITHPVDVVDTSAASIPYGRALSRQVFHVLDSSGRPCPVGEPGELFIGGAGVARGYIGAADLTEQRFINHPVLNERLYRTGDLGQWQPDGTIRFLGRNDRQVKIRGHRIELDEIEAILSRHHHVRVAVVAVTGSPARRTIVGYACPVRGQQLDGATLRDYVGLHLPQYMVPTTIHVVDDVPLTANGKVDLSELDSRTKGSGIPTGVDTTSATPAAALASPGCSAAAAPAPVDSWASVLADLGHPQIVIGGPDLISQGLTSVDLVRLANRIEDRHGVRPALRDLARGWAWAALPADLDAADSPLSKRDDIAVDAHARDIPAPDIPAPDIPAPDIPAPDAAGLSLSTVTTVAAPPAATRASVAEFLRKSADWLDQQADGTVVIAPLVGALLSLTTAAAESEAASRERPAPEPATPPIPPHPGEFPLTEMQLAYLVGRVDSRWGQPVAPHYYTEVDLDADRLDVSRLAAAFDAVQHRHPMLRARCTRNACQHVTSTPLATLDIVEDSTTAALLRERMQARVADPHRDPQLQLAVSRQGSQTIRLHLSLDLLFCDAHSAAVVVADLAAAYHGVLGDPPQRHFADWALAVAAARHSPQRERNLDYWRAALLRLRPGPMIPVATDLSDHPPSRRRRWCSTPDQLTRLTSRARREGISLDALVLSTFGLALARRDRSIGGGNTMVVTMFGRPDDHQDVVGDYTQTMLIEPRPDRCDDLTTYRRQVADDLLDGCDHSTGPGGVHANEVIRMARRAAWERNASGSGHAEFTVVYSSGLSVRDVANTPTDASELLEDFAGTGASTVFAISQTPQVLIDCQVFIRQATLRINIDARESLLPNGVIERLWTELTTEIQQLAGGEALARGGGDAAVSPPVIHTPTPNLATVRSAIVDVLRRRRADPTTLPGATIDTSATFFELGETSLTLVAMVAELGQVTGCEVSVLDMFAHPTPNALAEHLAQPEAATATTGSNDTEAPGPDLIAAALARGSRRRTIAGTSRR